MSRGERIFRATAIASALGYTGQALSLVAVPLYLRALGADNYGLMLAALSLAGYFGLADAGLSWGSLNLMGQAHGRRDRTEMAHIFRHGFVLALISSLLAMSIAIGVWLAARQGGRLPIFAGRATTDSLILIVGVQAASGPVTSMIYNVYYSLQEAWVPALFQGGARLLGTLAGIGAAMWTGEMWPVLAANLATTLLMGGVAAIGVWRRYPWILARGDFCDLAQYRQQFLTGGKNFLLQMSRVLVGTAPVMMLSSLAGPATVPLYTLAVSLFQIVLLPQQNWGAYAQSAYGEAWASGQLEWIISMLRQTIRVGLFLGGLMLGVGGALVGPVVALISHDRLQQPGWMGLGIAAACVTAAFVTLGQYLLTGINRQRQAAFAELGNGLLCMLCCAVAVHWLGPVAVGWGTVVAALATSLRVLRREICRHLNLHRLPIEGGLVSRIALATFGTYLLLWLWPAGESSGLNIRILNVIAQFVCGTALFAGLAWLAGALPMDELRAGWSRLRIHG